MATLAHDQTTVNAKRRHKCPQVKDGQVQQLHAAHWTHHCARFISELFRIWFSARLFEGNDEVLANDDVTNLSWHLLSEERSLDYLGPAAKRI